MRDTLYNGHYYLSWHCVNTQTERETKTETERERENELALAFHSIVIISHRVQSEEKLIYEYGKRSKYAFGSNAL